VAAGLGDLEAASTRSRLCQTADHREGLAGDEVCVVVGEDRRPVGDLVGLSHAADRYRPVEPADDLRREVALLTHLSDEGGVGGAGAHDVARHALLHCFSGDGFCEPDHSSFGSGIHRFERTSDSGGVAREVHDPAPPSLGHAGQDGVAGP